MSPASPGDVGGAGRTSEYDPFARGPFPVGVRTIHSRDPLRDRTFSCEVWYPAADRYTGQDLAPASADRFIEPPDPIERSQLAVRSAGAEPGAYPLILFSHSSGGRRRQSTFLCTHLASHGYLVAALDHSEMIAPELMRHEGETVERRMARVQGWIDNRVPDLLFLLDTLLDEQRWSSEAKPDPDRVGVVGHSFGGWTVLAAPEVDRRIRAVVALAPGGSSNPPPNIIPSKLTFQWARDVPTLYLVAETDTILPLDGMVELFERTQATKRMLLLRRSDHGHFSDVIEEAPGLCTTEQAHLFIRGLTLAHFDAKLRHLEPTHGFWNRDLTAELRRRGVEALQHPT